MAYVKKSKKNDPSYKRKKQSGFTPAERFLRFQLVYPENTEGEKSYYIDIAKELSKVNRRLYRQGMVYRVANISITSRDTVNGLFSASTAPDTWVTRNAWHRGFDLWNQMNRKVLDMPGAESRKSRFHDYKVFLSTGHKGASADALPGCMDNGNNAYVDGEWVYAEYQSPDGTVGTDAYTAHLLGNHSTTSDPNNKYNSVGLIKSYGEARATVPNTDVPARDSDGDDDPLLNLFDDGAQTDEIANKLDVSNDRAPYGNSNTESDIGELYPGSESNGPKPVVRRLVSFGGPDQSGGLNTKAVAAPTVMVPGFDAVCGLLEIEVQSEWGDFGVRTQEDLIDVVIELAPGSYKGVAAFDI
jgi:hypothetical protein